MDTTRRIQGWIGRSMLRALLISAIGLCLVTSVVACPEWRSSGHTQNAPCPRHGGTSPQHSMAVCEAASVYLKTTTEPIPSSPAELGIVPVESVDAVHSPAAAETELHIWPSEPS